MIQTVESSGASRGAPPAQPVERLKGEPSARAEPQPKASGRHPPDWLCKYTRTARQLTLGFSKVALLK